ncbi:uncharacterized protein LOC119967581 isoform X2 [Scyliorhinus canicula]|uniref:uncharacterized protein LOC119967581 isoform X2 n=1 Tax=Scyliorhinus canicula TaxID=7830 RepID=UPI0018F359C2|nr:uncharacterized protein LOC119967581 isoform X2 [Scyliorhinus canicula]
MSDPVQMASQGVSKMGLPASQTHVPLTVRRVKASLKRSSKFRLYNTSVKRIYDLVKCSNPEIFTVRRIKISSKSSTKFGLYNNKVKNIYDLMKCSTPEIENSKPDHKPAASLHIQPLLSLGAQFQDLSIPVTHAVQSWVQGKEREPQKEVLIEEMPVQDPTPSTSLSTNQGQRKRLAETPINENMPKRKKVLSTPPPKVSSVNTPSTGCTYTIKSSPVPIRMSTGHFSAWGVEDDEVLYYMQKDNGGQSEDTAFIPTCCQEAPKSPQHFQNSRNNCANQTKTAIQNNKKHKHLATREAAISNPETLSYTHFSEKLLNTSVTEMSTDRRSMNPCRVEIERVTAPQIPSGTEMFASLATSSSSSHMIDLICSVPQVSSSAGPLPPSPEERMTMEFLPTGTECATILQPTEISNTAWFSSVSTGTKANENMFYATSPPSKPTLTQDVNKEDIDPDEPAAKKVCRIQESMASISLPCVFDPPPIYAASNSAVRPMHYVHASTKSDMTTTAFSSKPVQFFPFLFGCSTKTDGNNFNSGTFASAGTFPSAFGWKYPALTHIPTNGGVAKPAITGNSSLLPLTGPGYHFSGNLVPNCNFGYPTNNAVFRFGAKNKNQYISQESFSLTPIVTIGAPRLPNSVQSCGFPHRKIKTARRKLRAM